MPWTEVMDEELKELARMNLTRAQIAQKMGVSKNSVSSRSRRIGVKFYSSTRRFNPSGHRPFSARCGEILREHGVML